MEFFFEELSLMCMVLVLLIFWSNLTFLIILLTCTCLQRGGGMQAMGTVKCWLLPKIVSSVWADRQGAAVHIDLQAARAYGFFDEYYG